MSLLGAMLKTYGKDRGPRETLERLQQIMLFRALEFPLEDIKKILESPGFDRLQALNDQIALLKMRRQHLDGLIDMAERMKTEGVNEMSFQAFDTGKIQGI